MYEYLNIDTKRILLSNTIEKLNDKYLKKIYDYLKNNKIPITKTTNYIYFNIKSLSDEHIYNIFNFIFSY